MDCVADIAVPTLGAMIADHAIKRPDAVALRFDARSWTYAALDIAVNRIAHALTREGCGPGDRVGYVGRNSDLLVVLAFAAARAGLIFVPVNWRLSRSEVERILADAETSVVFAATGYGATGDDKTRSIDLLLDDDWLSSDTSPPEVPIDQRDTVVLMYTSGTTGVPKGVMLSHRALLGSNVMRQRDAIDWDDWSGDDVTLVCIPMAHIGGFGLMLRTLFFGGEALIQETLDPGRVLDAVEHQRVSKLALVPTAIKMVIDHPRSRTVSYARIGTVTYGAAPITLDLLREAIAVFGCNFAQSYGMSETAATCVVLPPADHDVAGTPRMRSAGRALSGTELRIVGEDGTPLPVGDIGEIAIRTIGVMNGYWRMPEATAAVMCENGWYSTGDAGYLDQDGYLFIKDRVKDMIVSGAENVYPAEVENILADHPDVSQVAVIGIADPLWGEAVKAIVVPRAGHTIDPAGLIAWSKARIAHYKAPKSVEVVDALPLTASGKVQKAELRQRYRADAQEQMV